MNWTDTLKKELEAREEAFQVLESRFKSEIDWLNTLLESKNEEANSGHPDSLDTIKEQIKIQGQIDGLQKALNLIQYERLFG